MYEKRKDRLLEKECKRFYLFVGEKTAIPEEKIIGLFDIDRITVKKRARDFLETAEKKKMVISAAKGQIPISFVLCKDGKIVLSSAQTQTIKQKWIYEDNRRNKSGKKQSV